MSRPRRRGRDINGVLLLDKSQGMSRSEEHTSELQSQR